MDKQSRISRLKAKCAAATKRLTTDNTTGKTTGSPKRLCIDRAEEVSFEQDDGQEEEETDFEASFLESVGQDEDIRSTAGTLDSEFFRENGSGWTMDQVGGLLLYVAKSTGTSNATLSKFLKVIGLVVDGKRSPTDPKKHRKFPQSATSLKSLLHLNKDEQQQVVYICPYQRPVRKKRNQQWVTELCGYTLRETGEGNHKSYLCDLCETEWTRKIVEKDGNLIVINPLRRTIQETMNKYGSQIDPASQEKQENLHDVMDGERNEQMNIQNHAIRLAIHADAGEFSKSTNKKMYLIFVQVLNLPLRVRRCVWNLAAVWVGEHLPADRESFLLHLNAQLTELDENSDNFQPIVWKDKFGFTHSSPAYVYCVLAGSPERTALNGHLVHSSSQGCVYCLQVARSISHRICYKYVANPLMKSHDNFVQMSEKWDNLTPKERGDLLKKKLTKGFRRPSVISHWPKINMVDAFAIDVMHMMDEGVARWFLAQIVEGDGPLRLTAAQIKEIDKRWLQIIVPGNESRSTRSITHFRKMKAHELRFFLQHGAPFITKDIVPEEFHSILCLASSIGWMATRDVITEIDLTKIERSSNLFLRKFERFFGEAEMKFSIHLMQHVAHTVRLHGPLQNISCYGPENEIGRIGRRICAYNNNTKNIMADFRTLAECSTLVENLINDPETNEDVVRSARKIMGLTDTIFHSKNPSGTCKLIGCPDGKISRSLKQLVMAKARKSEEDWSKLQIYTFKKCIVENGIRVRTQKHNTDSCRNECLVMDDSGTAVAVEQIVTVVDITEGEVCDTFVFGEALRRTHKDAAGSGSAKLAHIFEVVQTNNFVLIPTHSIVKQLVILEEGDSFRIVSPPANIFRVT